MAIFKAYTSSFAGVFGFGCDPLPPKKSRMSGMAIEWATMLYNYQTVRCGEVGAKAMQNNCSMGKVCGGTRWRSKVEASGAHAKSLGRQPWQLP
jgi:hypothetical protein